MAVCESYGRLDVPSIGKDEPIFILRAMDVLAADAIKMYKLLAEAHGCDLGDVVDRQIRMFSEWSGEKSLPGRRPAAAQGNP